MALKNLLVQIDGSNANQRRVAAALGLAKAVDAHLTGLYVIAEPVVPGFVMAQMPSGVWDEQHRALRRQAEGVVAAFRDAVERAGLAVDTQIDSAHETDVSRVVAQHARYADMAILGQADPDDPQPGGSGLIADVVLGCGRPVLAIPYIGAGAALGERVVVAWDASRESARAVNDALPLLERAKKVTVITLNASDRPERYGELAGADISLHLARHGVKVQAEALEVHDIGIADAILSRLVDEEADLLVMGAYGHSRFSETLLGGVTRHVLRSMTVPVLMSH